MSDLFNPTAGTYAAGALVGPGSQPADEDGGTLDYMQMPAGMTIYAAPDLPEPEEATSLGGAMARLEAVLQALKAYENGGEAVRVDLSGLDAGNLDFINQVLGEGEVSVVAGADLQSQEAVLAGVWRVRRSNPERPADYVEVGRFPSEIRDAAFTGAQTGVAMPEHLGANIFNAPPLLPEINDAVALSGKSSEPHVINLSLLPHTEEDLAFLHNRLGKGDVIILSRGYGNCRITSTRTRNTWWVQYYNSQDTLILNSIEIVTLPEVACAAPEDISDSAERLDEILEIYR